MGGTGTCTSCYGTRICWYETVPNLVRGPPFWREMGFWYGATTGHRIELVRGCANRYGHPYLRGPGARTTWSRTCTLLVRVGTAPYLLSTVAAFCISKAAQVGGRLGVGAVTCVHELAAYGCTCSQNTCMIKSSFQLIST